MVKVVVGMMGSSVAAGSSAMATADQVKEFLDVVKSYNVKELDTAWVYNGGKSEELLGEVDAQKDFLISTKAPGFAPGSLAENKILANSAASHERLRQDKVDIYYIHGPDAETPLEEQCRAFNALYQRGKFNKFGISNLSLQQVQRVYDICKAEGYMLPKVYQGGYSPLHRHPESKLIPLLKKLDMHYYAFSPLAGGLLAKPIDKIVNPDKGSRYQEMKVFGDLFLKDQILDGLRNFTALCNQHDVSVMEATMRWFMHHAPLDDEDAMILGASRTAQIEATLAACKRGPLPDAIVKGFDDMWEAIKDVAPDKKLSE